MKAYLIILALIVPMEVLAISDNGPETAVSDTLILVPLEQGREVRILEGEYVELRLSDGSKINGSIQEIGSDYILVDRLKVFTHEISKITLKPLEGSRPKKKGGKFLKWTAGVILAVFGIKAISNGGVDGLFESPSASGPLGELVGLLFWIIGIVVLAVTALVVGVFLLILLLSALGLSAGKMASKKTGTTYNIERDYTIKTGISK